MHNTQGFYSMLQEKKLLINRELCYKRSCTFRQAITQKKLKFCQKVVKKIRESQQLITGFINYLQYKITNFINQYCKILAYLLVDCGRKKKENHETCQTFQG